MTVIFPRSFITPHHRQFSELFKQYEETIQTYTKKIFEIQNKFSAELSAAKQRAFETPGRHYSPRSIWH